MSSWLEVDVDGLRKTLSRKGKVWALHELIQNSWDAEATQVNVTLTKPKDGISTLTCLDNAPGGFADLTHAHTLFAESDKKDKVQKRGRFSAGDKYVLALMKSATVTSTTGQIVFQQNGQRKTNDKHTEVGSEFKGILVVSIDENLKWHVDIQQKVPLNIERDNVTPTYLKTLYTALLTEKVQELTEEDANAAWVTTAAENDKTDKKVVKAVFDKRFGENAVLYDQGDVGSNKEAAAAGKTVVPKGSMTPEMRKNVLAAGVKKAGEEYSTKFLGSNKVIPEDLMTPSQKQFRQFIQDVAPVVLPERPLKGVKFVDDNDSKVKGCTQWLDPKGFEFTVNIAYQDVDDWADNYSLFIHELAHFYVQRNDHLFEGFWRAVDYVGGRLAAVALARPKLFPSKPSIKFSSLEVAEEDELEAVAASQA